MNKKTKGAIAAGAAAALLAGGAGSFALWSDSETIGGGSIASGKLTLETVPGSSGWTVNNAPLQGDIADFKAVPGDALVYSTQVKIGAEGTNLDALLTADLSTITGDEDLKTALAPVVSATVNGTALTSGGTGVAIDETNDEDIVDVEITFNFANPSTVDNSAQGQSIDLSGLALKLEQTS